MSIKTLRKRIALAAVTALGAGLLSIVTAPVSSAAAFSTNVYNWGESQSDQNFESSDAGFCSENDTTDTLVVRYPSSNTTWKLVITNSGDDLDGQDYAFITASGGSGYWSTNDFTDNGVFEGVDKSGDERTLTIGETSGAQTTRDLPADLAWVATGTGTVTMNLYSVRIATGVSTLVETYTLVVGANCDAAAVYSPTYSGSSLRTASTALTATTYDDGDDSGAVSVEYATGVSYLGHWLRDAYGEAVTDTSSFLNVAATGGCTVSGTTTDISSTSTSIVVTSGITNKVVKLFAGSSKSQTCRVVSSYNGTTVSDKTISFKGDAASVKMVAKDYAIGTASVGAGYYDVFDDAGARLAGFAPTATDLTGSLVGASISFGTSTASSTQGAVTIDTVDTARGTGTFKIRVTKGDGSFVYSDPITMTVSGSVDKYSLSLDKASYGPGEIITVTISAKDSGGRIVPDGTTLSTSGNLSFTIAGATALSAAPAHGDASENGAWVYKYTAGTTEGDWAANVTLANIATDTAKQVTYVIKSKTAAVSNAEVLAAIVKLIASINKQIRALQRQLGR